MENLNSLKVVSIKGKKFEKVSAMGNKIIFVAKQERDQVLTLELKQGFVEAKMPWLNHRTLQGNKYSYFKLKGDNLIPCSHKDTGHIFDIHSYKNTLKVPADVLDSVDDLYNDDEKYYSNTNKGIYISKK